MECLPEQLLTWAYIIDDHHSAAGFSSVTCVSSVHSAFWDPLRDTLPAYTMSFTAVPEISPTDNVSVEMQEKTAVHLKGGSREDQRDMVRMGKTQELRVRDSRVRKSYQIYTDSSHQRNFKLIGIIGFVSILQSTWENALLANYYALLNGGTAGFIWTMIAVWLFMMCMIASM